MLLCSFLARTRTTLQSTSVFRAASTSNSLGSYGISVFWILVFYGSGYPGFSSICSLTLVSFIDYDAKFCFFLFGIVMCSVVT